MLLVYMQKYVYLAHPVLVVKHYSFSLGAMNEAEVLDAVESTFVIGFLMLSILSVKKFIKSLLLNWGNI